MADVLRAANEFVSASLIEDYALGGALAAIYYVEPFTTYDADIFFVAKDKTLSAGIPAIYVSLQSKGWRVEREHRAHRTDARTDEDRQNASRRYPCPV